MIVWDDLLVITPTADDVERAAPRLAVAYNDPQNAPLLGHTELLTERDVVDHYARLRDSGAHGFLLFRDGDLAGDGDLRDIADGAGEFAFLVAAPAHQGKGLGTRFATMIHAFAFQRLGLERVFASVIPANVASRRVFEKLGYTPADTDAYGDEGDVTLVIERARFVEQHAAALAEIRIVR